MGEIRLDLMGKVPNSMGLFVNDWKRMYIYGTKFFFGEDMIFGGRFHSCVDCALVVCTHSHTKSLGGYPLGVCGVGAAVCH